MDDGKELLRELVIDGVVARLEELVVMNAFDSPKRCLIVENLALFVEGLVVRAPEDAVRMRVAGRLVAVQWAVVPGQSGSIVIPVSGEGESVSNQRAKEDLGCGHGCSEIERAGIHLKPDLSSSKG